MNSASAAGKFLQTLHMVQSISLVLGESSPTTEVLCLKLKLSWMCSHWCAHKQSYDICTFLHICVIKSTFIWTIWTAYEMKENQEISWWNTLVSTRSVPFRQGRSVCSHHGCRYFLDLCWFYFLGNILCENRGIIRSLKWCLQASSYWRCHANRQRCQRPVLGVCRLYGDLDVTPDRVAELLLKCEWCC